jgi:hypothetical protein
VTILSCRCESILYLSIYIALGNDTRQEILIGEFAFHQVHSPGMEYSVGSTNFLRATMMPTETAQSAVPASPSQTSTNKTKTCHLSSLPYVEGHTTPPWRNPVPFLLPDTSILTAQLPGPRSLFGGMNLPPIRTIFHALAPEALSPKQVVKKHCSAELAKCLPGGGKPNQYEEASPRRASNTVPLSSICPICSNWSTRRDSSPAL